jgi:hypothetical protein
MAGEAGPSEGADGQDDEDEDPFGPRKEHAMLLADMFGLAGEFGAARMLEEGAQQAKTLNCMAHGGAAPHSTHSIPATQSRVLTPPPPPTLLLPLLPLLTLLLLLYACAEHGDVLVSGIAEDADEVLPGDLYCCVERLIGLGSTHGADEEPLTAALAAGAVAVIAPRGVELPIPLPPEVPLVLADDVDELAGRLAVVLYGACLCTTLRCAALLCSVRHRTCHQLL